MSRNATTSGSFAIDAPFVSLSQMVSPSERLFRFSGGDLVGAFMPDAGDFLKWVVFDE